MFSKCLFFLNVIFANVCGYDVVKTKVKLACNPELDAGLFLLGNVTTCPAGKIFDVFHENNLRGQVVQNMSTWASTTQESWVSYHITREQMGDAILKELEKAQVKTCLQPLI